MMALIGVCDDTSSSRATKFNYAGNLLESQQHDMKFWRSTGGITET